MQHSIVSVYAATYSAALQEVEELQQQLQDSTHEVIRLESEAAVLDEKAVHLQMQLDEAQREHATALQVCNT